MLVEYLKKLFVRTPNSHRRGSENRPSYEILESRNLLAATLTLNGTELTIQGTSLNDIVQITQVGDDVEVAISGGETANYIESQLTMIYFNGFAGNDSFTNNSFIACNANGHAGFDVLIGGEGNDILQGGSGQDQLYGNGGNDQIFGYYDIDVIDAGDGDDLVRAGSGNDIVDGGEGDDYLYADWGDDIVNGGLGNDEIFGGGGSDSLFGGEGNDNLWGQNGFDSIHGDAGEDSLVGGPDSDWLYGGSQNDVAWGSSGDDYVWGESGDDTLQGMDGNDVVKGGWGNDYVYGNGGSDMLFGGEGQDVIRGGDGNDEIQGENGSDNAYGEAGDDLIFGGAGLDSIWGGDGNDELDGEDGDDDLHGGKGDDVIRGADGVDSLMGNDGNDLLNAGLNSGVDTLVGGKGFDRFLVRSSFQVNDLSPEDARIVFEDVTSAWTNGEVEVVTRAFDQLFEMTNNNRLLQDSVPSGDLTFYKHHDLNGAAGINYLLATPVEGQGVGVFEYEREIQIAEWDESNEEYNDLYQSTIIHEIAHNWDDDFELDAVGLLPLWREFMTIGGWTDVDPQSSNYTLSDDGQWWYLSSASFADPNGRTNPFEDMATLWDHYFNDGLTGDAGLLQKLAIVDQVVLSSADDPFEQIFYVETLDQFVTALAATRGTSTRIVVTESITLAVDSSYSIGVTHSPAERVEIECVGNGEFVSQSTERSSNQFTFIAKRVSLLNFVCSGYEGNGGLLKNNYADCKEFSMLGGRITNCGVVPSAADVRTQILVGGNLLDCTYRIEGVTFTRCCLNNDGQSHVIYLSPVNRLYIRDNTFIDAGQLKIQGSGTAAEFCEITGNSFTNTGKTSWDWSSGEYVYPSTVMRFYGDSSYVVSGNTIRGDWARVYTGYWIDALSFDCNHNDIQCNVTGGVNLAIDASATPSDYYNLTEWRAAGNDIDSIVILGTAP